MTLVPTISITTPDLENQQVVMNSPLTASAPPSPTIFDVVKNMEDLPEFISDDDEQQDFCLDPPAITEPSEQPEQQQQQQQQTESTLFLPQHVRPFYQNKSILLTGATGFIGKALLWKLLQSLHQDIACIYLLIRLPPSQRRLGNPALRLQEDILSNKAFVSLRRQMGTTLFDQLVKEKVIPIYGDLLQDNLGLSEQDHKTLVKHTNVIFHCAGNMDAHERLDISVKVNAAGTNSMIQLANECGSLSSFVYLTPLKTYGTTRIPYDRVGILPQDVSVEDLMDQFLESNDEDLTPLMNQVKPYYQNSYTFSMALAEHILVNDVRKKQLGNFPQFPIGILRLGHIGPSVAEPLKGWADDVNGANGVILLTGRGTRVIDTNHGQVTADVVPVDVAVRTILACASTMALPPSHFTLPTTDDTSPDTIPEKTTSTPSSAGTTTPPRDSTSSYSSTATINTNTTTTTTPGGKEATPSSRTSSMTSDECCFPYIYPVSANDMHAITWRQAYEAMRYYWARTTGVTLAPANAYFTASAQGLSRARTVMNSLRSAASTYMTNSAPTPTATTSSTAAATNGRTTTASDPSSAAAAKRRSVRPISHRSSHLSNRLIDKAARLAPNVMRTYTTSPNTHRRMGPCMAHLVQRLHDDPDTATFDPHALISTSDAPLVFWTHYFTNASFGMHLYVMMEPHARLPTAAPGWSCALHKTMDDDVIDHQIRSEIYSLDQINKRTLRMIEQLKHLLIHDDNHHHNSTKPAASSTMDDAAWLADVDDSLEDWCQDQTVIHALDKRSVLGKWRKKVGSNDDAVKVVVLNDKRVNQAIHQITQNAGVSKQTAVNEAMKILARMSERTQLTFVWFTGSFLKSLFDNMFESVRISEEGLRYIRDSTIGKRVVYVPVSRSLLDPLLVWYITIRYHLPVPALICDEVMAQLGPISDLYRLAGAYYVKRDKSQRSPLNSAVTAAYTQVLLREHGALSMCLEKSRSRTGKYQEAFEDEVIDMVMESTLQSNQSRSSLLINKQTAATATATDTPPESPDSPATPASATMSMDSATGQPRKVHRDIMLVPINISYEMVPELGALIDQVLDQQHHQPRKSPGPTSPSTSSTLSPTSTSSSSSSSNTVLRPSQAMDKRNRLLDGGVEAPKKSGRVHVGLGRLISVQEVAMEINNSTQRSADTSEETIIAADIIRRIQENQSHALVVTPLSLICAIVLYGRATGGVCLGKIKEFLEWLRKETLDRHYHIDWQDGEDLESIIFSVFRLINEPKNLIIEGKEMTDDTNIRVNDHADNIMALSYYSNQMVNVFLLDAFFCVVYLSFSEDTVAEDDFMDRFRFLVQLLEKEFVLHWDIDKQFQTILTTFEKGGVIRRKNKDQFLLLVSMETDAVRYEQLIFLASLIYPTIDTYWITSCSLSALERVPTLPRSIVPLLSQWIATHLITGRRTIYREVLSTESSRMAVDVFMSMGFLTEFQAKEKLSPDAQILLHELNIPTTETLIELTGQNSDGGMTPVSPNDPEGMMKALMAQIQMNRANSNMADLCQQIDSYRLGAASQRESFQNAQVFQKCLKQIKGILQVDVSFAKKRQVVLDDIEDGLVQLVYALRVNSVASSSSGIGGGTGGIDKSLRRISEAYNLK